MGDVGRVSAAAPAAPRTIEVRSPDAMRRLGQRLGALLEPGDFIGLVGDLGAGKTVLVRGVAEGAHVPPGQVASPTFAIVYPYDGRIRIHHADLYRLGDADELYATGFYDLLEQPAATLVEWVDRIPEAMPAERLVIRIERTGERSRKLVLEPAGRRAVELAQALAARPRRAKPARPA